MLLLEWLWIKFGVVWYVTQPVFNRRTSKLYGRTVYQRTLWLIGDHKKMIEFVLYIRCWYNTPLLWVEENREAFSFTHTFPQLPTHPWKSSAQLTVHYTDSPSCWAHVVNGWSQVSHVSHLSHTHTHTHTRCTHSLWDSVYLSLQDCTEGDWEELVHTHHRHWRDC